MPAPSTICRSLLLAALLLGAGGAAGAAAEDGTATGHRPRVGLVLSGGGARGAAHIGVLKQLDALHIPVDVIVGTSMGAVVGGLYASGMTGSEIERLLSSVDWQDAFRDRPARDALAFRRKEEDRDFLVNLPLGLRGKELLIPTGLIQGQKLTQILRSATAGVATVDDFDHLAVRFRAVATDLESGQPVVMADGDLTTAMRASMSAPGVFAPVERNGRLLVDGGLVKNLPVDVGLAMGADVLIVVDASPPLEKRTQLDSLTRVSNQAVAIMMRRETETELRLLRPGDLLLVPNLSGQSSFNFTHLDRAVAAGELEVQSHLAELRRLQVSPEQYAEVLARRRAARAGMPVVSFVRTQPADSRYAQQIQQRFGDMVGVRADAGAIEERITQIYGQGLLESLDYRLVPAAADRDQFGLQFTARRNSWGPDYLKLGLSLQDDFSGNSQFDAAARLLFTELNRRNGELALNMQVGEEPRFALEYYQPLSLRLPYFVAPHGQVRAYNIPQLQGTDQIGEFRVRTRELGLDAGVELGNWGELRGGLLRTAGRTRIRLGDPTIPQSTFNVNAAFARFAYDRLDAANFPRRGQALTLELRFESDVGASGTGSNLLTADWRGAHSWGNNTGVLWLSAGETVGGNQANVRTWFPVGGFLSLSGLRARSLAGPHYMIGRAIFLRQIGSGGEGVLNVPGYVGLSLEGGNTWQQRSDISLGSLRFDASLFFGADTYIGPAYLAFGYDQSGSTALYLFLGKSF